MILQSRLKSFFTSNLATLESSEDYRRIIFINISILVLSAISLFFIFFNFFVTFIVPLGLVHCVNLILTISIAVYLRKKANVPLASFLLLGLIFLLTFSALYFTNHSDNILVWIFFFPLASFYLLGTNRGLRLSSAYIIILLAYLFTVASDMSFTSQANITVSIFFFTALLYYNELGREELFATLNFTLARLKGQKELLKEISTTDKLTQLFNRSKLDEFFSNELINARITATPFSIILLDIDRFKKINDLYGHQTGDNVLAKLGHLLKKHTRSTDIVGRWGGEEFLIIASGSTLKEAAIIAENLRKLIEKETFTPVKKVTSSFGVASFDQKALNEDEHTMLKRADECLYTVKQKGRNGVLTETILSTNTKDLHE